MRCLLALALALALAACSSEPPPEAPPERAGDAQARALIDRAIAAHGGDAYNPARIAFTFRGTPHVLTLDGDRYAYARTRAGAAGTHVETLDNDGVRRSVGGRAVPLAPEEAASLRTALNSVAYFVLLPYRLRDPAVVATYAGPDTVAGEPYERVAVAFTRDGGGPDYEDAYLYWFHRDRHTMEYLAYSYSPDGTPYQSRFRVAFHPRTVGGIRFADYLNLAAPDSVLQDDLARYGALYDAGRLDTISTVQTEDVRVSRPR